MVYGVFGGEYSDWYVIGYFDNRDDADKYCCVCGGDYYVKTLQDLSSERDLSHVELKYTFEIQFVHDTNKNIWVMCDDINDYQCYIDSKLHCNYIILGRTWIRFHINTDHKNKKLAEKIAQDYLAELRSYGNGDVYKEYVDLMNNKFKEPFIKAEELEKARKLKEKELAELKRLKEKYKNEDI